MADASSVRKATSLPTASGANASSLRYSGKELFYSTGTQWAPLDRVVLNVILDAEDAVDRLIFLADKAYQIVSVSEVHSVAGGASSTIDVKKCTGTTAPASGTTVLATAFAADSTANTTVNKTLSSTAANTALAAGDRLAIDATGTITGYVGVLRVVLRPV